MSGTRAEWHLAELTSDADPFASAVYSAGLDISLDSTLEELESALRTTLDREGRMWETGLTCEMKDKGQDCRTCLLATVDLQDVRARLCRLGKDQQAIMQRWRDIRDAQIGPMVRVAEECAEIGHLPDDLAELLTAVGL